MLPTLLTPTDDENICNADEDFEGSDEGELLLSDYENNQIVIDKNDRSLSEMNRWFVKGKLIRDPDWQRGDVWDDKRRSKLIESFLLEIPVPVIYFHKNEEEKYEVIDGRQRLTSVFRYFNNEFKLKGLEILQALNGKRFNELETHHQEKLEDTTVRTFELSSQTDKNVLFLLFERLNSGGVALNDMEIRNCIFRGELNSLIKLLSENNDFVRCLNIKNIDRRMLDRTLVLRFLAFYERTHLKAKEGLKKFLNEFFKTYQNATNEKLKEFEQKFNHSMKASLTIFGENSFRLRKLDKHGNGSWSSRPNSTIFQVLSVTFSSYDLARLTRHADAIYEEYLDLIANDPEWVKAVTIATGEHFNIKLSFERWDERIKNILSHSYQNDASRCYSRNVKKQFFDQDNTCAICNQKISLIEDSVLDHIEHYWRGGQTIPSNARLAHRLCNAKRKH